MSFHDAACLSTEERKDIVNIIVDIKRQEKDQMDRATRGTRDYHPPSTNLSSIKNSAKFSSLNKNWSNPRPNIPKR